MYLNKADIEAIPRVKRLNIINSISGIKPGNLIGSQSNKGVPNLAIFSSVVHLGSNPAYLGFILRPQTETRRDTYENILENGSFTINHIQQSFIKKAHYTSTKFDKTISEFEKCGLKPKYIEGFAAPFVRESLLQIGLKHVESIPIKVNDTLLVVGEVEHLSIPNNAIDERGYIDLELLNGAGIGGLNSYYELKKISEFPYARITEFPEFENEQS
jgi:flavin reductase (DIM6/NTAB) family NADH-FMN oxidoreductase RutF